MKTLVRIYTQYTDENGKLKGGQEFETYMDSDTLLYGDKDTILSAAQEMVNEAMENWAGSYYVMDYEPIFHKPMKLDGKKFEEKIIEKARKFWAEHAEGTVEDPPDGGEKYYTLTGKGRELLKEADDEFDSYDIYDDYESGNIPYMDED